MRKPGSERIDHSMRVKFNPLALLLDSSLEGEFDLVQRIIYEVRNVVSLASFSAVYKSPLYHRHLDSIM